MAQLKFVLLLLQQKKRSKKKKERDCFGKNNNSSMIVDYLAKVWKISKRKPSSYLPFGILSSKTLFIMPTKLRKFQVSHYFYFKKHFEYYYFVRSSTKFIDSILCCIPLKIPKTPSAELIHYKRLFT